DVLIADPVNADFGSVETRAGNGVYGPVPEQDAHPAGPITPKLWIKGNFVGTLQGSPRSEESLRVSHRAFASTPGPAIGQHLCLVNLHIVGIAGEHALQIAVLDRSTQPADHRHLIRHRCAPFEFGYRAHAGRRERPASLRTVGSGHRQAPPRQPQGGAGWLPAANRPRRRLSTPQRRGWHAHRVVVPVPRAPPAISR